MTRSSMNLKTSSPVRVFEPIGIMELTPGRCACLVPVEPYPRYCGLPATHKYRMCEYHAKAYFAFPVPLGESKTTVRR